MLSLHLKIATPYPQLMKLFLSISLKKWRVSLHIQRIIIIISYCLKNNKVVDLIDGHLKRRKERSNY